MIKIVFKRGIMVFLVMVLGILAFASEAAGFAGNIYVENPLLAGKNIYLINNNDPSKNAGDLTEGVNFNVFNDVVHAAYQGKTWRKYNITSSAIGSIYVLFKGGGNYALNGPFALGTTKPEDYFIEAITEYNAATPPAPSPTLSLNGLTFPDFNGIVSSAIGNIAAGYQQTGTQYALYEVTGGTAGETDGDLGDAAVTSGSGTLTSYQIASSSGKMYRVSMAFNNWFTTDANRAWGSSTNVQVPAVEGAPAEVLLTWNLTSGINILTIPFNLTKAVKGVVGEGADVVETEVNISTVQNLIAEINRQAPGDANVVTVFGWYHTADAASKKHVGLTSIAYTDAGAIADSSTTKTGTDLVANIPSALVVSGRAYQADVNQSVVFKLKGFMQ